jgi:hypothetical protein
LPKIDETHCNISFFYFTDRHETTQGSTEETQRRQPTLLSQPQPKVKEKKVGEKVKTNKRGHFIIIIGREKNES